MENYGRALVPLLSRVLFPPLAHRPNFIRKEVSKFSETRKQEPKTLLGETL